MNGRAADEFSLREFADARFKTDRRDVHGFCHVFGNKVDHKLCGFTNVSPRVFRPTRVVTPDADPHGRRIGCEGV